MILAAVTEDKETISIIEPEKDVPAGTKLS